MQIVRGNEDDLMAFYERHDELPVTFEQFKIILKDWDVWCLIDRSKIAIFLTKDGEGHVAAYKNAKVGILKIKWAIKKLGINKSRIPEYLKSEHSLAVRLGFKRNTTINGIVHYVH